LKREVEYGKRLLKKQEDKIHRLIVGKENIVRK
jgi:hypothetical protein